MHKPSPQVLPFKNCKTGESPGILFLAYFIMCTLGPLVFLPFARDIASTRGLWQQQTLKFYFLEVYIHCLCSVSESYSCARLCTIESFVPPLYPECHCLCSVSESCSCARLCTIKSFLPPLYPECHSREKRYLSLPPIFWDDAVYACTIYMWQSQVENKHYSVA